MHLLDKVKEKLSQLKASGIIEYIKEPSRWVSPMVVITKPNGDIRICIDMRQANKAIIREKHPLPTVDGIFAEIGEAEAEYFFYLRYQGRIPPI